MKAEGNGRPIVQQCCCRWRQDTGYTKGNQRGIKGNNKIIVEIDTLHEQVAQFL